MKKEQQKNLAIKTRQINPFLRFLLLVAFLFSMSQMAIAGEDAQRESDLELLGKSIESLLPSQEKDDLKGRYYLLLARNRLNEKKYKETLSILENSSEYITDEKMATLLRGIAYYYTESFYEAEAELLNIAYEEGGNKDALYLLGKIYYERGNLAIAIETWERALSIDDDDIELERMIAKAKREAAVELKMDKAFTGRFLINYDGKRDEEMGDAVASILEEAYYDVGSDLNFFPDKDITVILYTEKEFKEVTLAPGWAGGLYDGKIRIPAGGAELTSTNLKRLIYHEYTHAVIHSLTRGLCPRWLHEGLAMYEESRVGREGVAFGFKSINKAGLSNLGNIDPLFSSTSRDDVIFAYDRSHALVTYLIDNYGIHKMAELLHKLSDKQSLEETFNQVYGDYNLSFDMLWKNVYKD